MPGGGSRGGRSFFKRGGLKFIAGFQGGSLFFAEIFRTFLINNFEVHLIPVKIALQCILNTFIYF